ncbi:MAG: hypothetical protein Q7S36_00925 [Candidatus Liptonbacteria bacterium]|nr:hypothetical protein [Candidatus Liptonbacteria bacterium]
MIEIEPLYSSLPLKEKYKIWNYALVLASGLYAVSGVINGSGTFNSFDLPSLALVISPVGLALLPFFWQALSQVLKYEAGGYLFLFILIAFQFYRPIGAFLDERSSAIGADTIVINSILITMLLIFSLVMKKKIFPEIPFLRNISNKQLAQISESQKKSSKRVMIIVCAIFALWAVEIIFAVYLKVTETEEHKIQRERIDYIFGK